MKILMATHYFGSHQGGIELVGQKLFQEFQALQQQIVWIASDASAPPEGKTGGRVVSLPVWNFVERKLGLPFPIPTVKALTTLRREIKGADILILHDCLYLSNIAAFWLARRRKIPIIIIQHIGLVPYSNRLLKWLMRIANRIVTGPMLRKAEQVVFISETTKRYFMQLADVSFSTVIFNGVDTTMFRPPNAVEEKAEIRKRLKLPASPPLILFVGRFVEKKGLTILREMAALAPDWTWAFAGWGPLDPAKWNLDNVHVFYHLQAPELAELYRASDLLVLPSTGEGFPLVIQEALASGLPVVCGADTAQADPAMSPFVQGVSLGEGDDLESANAFLPPIKTLLTSQPGSRAAKCRETVLSRYSWRRTAERYLEIASSLTSQQLVKQKRPIAQAGQKHETAADV